MHDRRNFLKMSAVGLAGLVANPNDLLADESKSKKMATVSWKNIEKQFDIDKNINYLNNGTAGLSPKSVQKAVFERMKYINLHGVYGGLEQELLNSLAAHFGIKSNEIALTHNVTEGINIAAWALPLKSGDEVILTNHEHVGNAVPWLNRQKKDGIKVVMAEIKPTAEQTFEEIKSKCTAKTKVIAVPHITCTLGQILPVKQLVELAKSRGIKTFIDGAHGAGMLNLDLKELGCDMYATCGHKWMLGPKGTGFVYINEELISELNGIFVGAGSDTRWDISDEMTAIEDYVKTGHRFYYGTQNSALYAGWIEAINFFETLGQDKVEERIRSLNQHLFEGLKSISTIKILTPEETISRCGVVSFLVSNKSDTVMEQFRKDGWILRFVAESKLDCIRVSTHIYNTENQIDALLEKLKNA
ncbi:MAG: aminotransferase class V-fold PLP-dependent enzyme [Flavobacteriales bacterium]|nr:aminotransferase class V-fold PLP-dependent enzyme [Flavobacteriales bacterium]